jgi:hypothetical protein
MRDFSKGMAKENCTEEWGGSALWATHRRAFSEKGLRVHAVGARRPGTTEQSGVLWGLVG